MVTALKEWDKLYNLHQKTVNPELTLIIDINMKPLSALMKSNYDYYNVCRMIQAEADKRRTQEVAVEDRLPNFRIEPLEREFIKDYAEICRILQTVPGSKVNEKDLEPTAERKLLKHPYDIKQMMDTLKYPLRDELPFRYYFEPLKHKLMASQTELYEMYKRGRLLVKYEIPLNEKMHDTICATIQQDFVVQLLASTALKRDQFKFIYEVQKIIFNCALRKEFLDIKWDDEKELASNRIFNKVIPELTVLLAMLRIRDIDDKKKHDIDHG